MLVRGIVIYMTAKKPPERSTPKVSERLPEGCPLAAVRHQATGVTIGIPVGTFGKVPVLDYHLARLALAALQEEQCGQYTLA